MVSFLIKGVFKQGLFRIFVWYISITPAQSRQISKKSMKEQRFRFSYPIFTGAGGKRRHCKVLQCQ